MGVGLRSFPESVRGPIHDIPDIVANLDLNEDEFADLSEDEVTDVETTKKQMKAKNSRPIQSGAMRAYLGALRRRLRVEFDNSNQVSKLRDFWLRKHIDGNDWWIRKEHAEAMCRRLNLSA